MFEGVWYDHVDGTPAYGQSLSDELREVMGIADRILEGNPAVGALNRQPPYWRDH